MPLNKENITKATSTSTVKNDHSKFEENNADVPKPPDGGWGWVIVFCSFMIQMIFFGISLSFGIYYVEFLRYFGESNGATSWVISIMNGMIFCVGPLASGLTKQFGCRTVTITGALLATFGLIVSIFAPYVTFLYLSIGICTEASGNDVGVYLPTVTAEISVNLPAVTNPEMNNCPHHSSFIHQIYSHKFKGRKNSASLLQTGFAPWRKSIYRVTSHRSREEVPKENPKRNNTSEHSTANRLSNCLFSPIIKDTFKEMTNFRLLKDNAFLVFTLSNFCTNIGLDVPYIYTKDRVIDMNIAEDTYASYVLSVIGISSTVSRIFFGYLSDLSCINRMWLFSSILIICGLSTAFSFFCQNYYLMAVYAAVFGGMSGGYNSLQSVILVDLVGLEKLTNGFGLLLLFEGVACLIGPPITGSLYDYTQSYNPGFYVSGFMMAFSGFVFFLIPFVQRVSEGKSVKAQDLANISSSTEIETSVIESKSKEEISTKM
ncbi:Monocarboxylate transporter 9, partial [Stegodyphus mimosarum]